MSITAENGVVKHPVTPPLPRGTKPLANQVGGHILGRENGHKKNKTGFLQSDHDTILKPVQGPVKGERELLFYQTLFSTDTKDQVSLQLQTLVPHFYGIWTTPEHCDFRYIELEDVTKRFAKPCIMDAKIGPVTYDRDADIVKIEREKAKFPALERVGFQLVGIKSYRPEHDDYITIERKFLRALDERTILTQGICPFFGEQPVDARLVKAFVRRLRGIERWFVEQRQYQFIASSLLLVYEGDLRTANGQTGKSNHLSSTGCSSQLKATNTGETCDDDDVDYDSLIDVRMIDFTHVFLTDATDENYLIGLRSMIDYLGQLI